MLKSLLIDGTFFIPVVCISRATDPTSKILWLQGEVLLFFSFGRLEVFYYQHLTYHSDAHFNVFVDAKYPSDLIKEQKISHENRTILFAAQICPLIIRDM